MVVRFLTSLCDVGFIRSPLNSAHPEATVMSQAACNYSCLQICSSSAVDDVTHTLQTQIFLKEIRNKQDEGKQSKREKLKETGANQNR